MSNVTCFPLAYCGLFLLAGNRESFGKVRFAFPSTGQLIKKNEVLCPVEGLHCNHFSSQKLKSMNIREL